MKKTNHFLKFLIMMGIMMVCILIAGKVQAGSITLNKLDFQIQLNEDGSMDVTENWNARINSTNTMFKDFNMDSSKFSGIEDVEVFKINSDNTRTKLTKINEEMYHVTKDCYYGLSVKGSKFEIAWGVDIKNTETRNYEIKYKVSGAVKTYQDCSELYWQLVGTDNTIPVTKLNATIKLPKKVQDKNNLRGWAHGPYNGNINVGTDRVTLDLDYLDSGVMVEARVVTMENLFLDNKVQSTNKLNTILQQEQKWANEANEERESYQKEREKEAYYAKIWGIVKIVASIILSIFLIYKLIRNGMKASKIEKKPSPIIDYFRDIPDEKASSGDAAFLYYFKNGNFSANNSKVLAATILQLSLKKYIAFSVDNTKKKPEIRINILDYAEHMKEMSVLKKDEQIIYNLLTKVADETSKDIRTFTMKEFEKYAQKHSSSFVTEMNKIEKEVKQEQEKLGNYNSELIKKASTYAAYATLYITFGIFMFFVIPIPAILMILNCIPHFIMNGKTNTLTEKGIEEAAKWKGLKKYMEDFSLLNEKEVPDLVLWEKYLVYATVFGIADKVLKQLKVRYPELQQISGSDYIYMNLLYHSTLNTAFLTSLNTSTDKVYMGGMSSQASSGYGGGNFSSGGGFGGGFSGGGGFGGGGGRNGRKIKVEKMKEIILKF